MTSRLATPEPPAPDHAWQWVSSIDVRQGDHPAIPTPIPGMLEGRVTLLAGAGGSGKTTLTEQLIRHLCSGRQLGKFPLPESPLIGWCVYLEDVAAMAQDRSLRAAPLGSLYEDDYRERHQSPVRYLFGRDFRISDLRRELETAKDEDVLPGVVIIDHLRILIGSQPAGTSPNDWERRNLLKLVDMADEFDLHIIVLTHLNKEGKVSGTTELINSVDTAYVIQPSPENREYATLVCHKMRMSPETDYALMKKGNGTWGFTDQAYVSENLAIGIARDIIRVLKVERRRTLSELMMHPQIAGERAGIRAALDRSKRRGWVRWYRGHWELLPGAGDEMLQPPEPDPGATDDGPAPSSTPPAPLPAPREPADDVWDPAPEADDVWDPAPEAEDAPGFRGLEKLRESFKRSKMHPVACIPIDQRGDGPWPFITEKMAGEPRWERAEMPLGGQLVTIDRNGSFPSACSSVPLAPNRLIHAGPQDFYDTSRAGIYQIHLPVWDSTDVPHPLGRIARGRQAGELVWITTPHLRLLDQLSLSHRIRRPEIVNSYIGRSNGSLFQHFYKEARAAREELAEAGGEPYVAYKRSVSIALRLLWPKKARSPFWRPDWRVSMVAEAAVRHWVMADKAVTAGAVLVSLGNCDEATFWTPDGHVPEPYAIGLGFGQVKVKPQVESEK